mgnify:CR=1
FVVFSAKPNRFTRTKNKNQDQKTGKTSKADFQGFFVHMPLLIVKRFTMARKFARAVMSLMDKPTDQI